MGKLLALELYNFKSYRGHHVMQFGDSYFTSIIGPNGSGKSNSMDAISFVLGIKSSHLRSTHLKDLVYRGRVMKNSKINADGTVAEDGADDDNDGDDADGGASDDEDEVELPRSQRDDPQTAWVMAVYEDDAGEEQRWKRTITSGGQSEYRINNRPVTAKVYNEALEAENILIKARNFLVFQGDVEMIASQSPKDLTKLIEQISGSVDHKAAYEARKEEKEAAEAESSLKNDSRRTINGEIREYQKQKAELDKYEQTRDERDQAVVTHVLWKLFHFQRTIQDSTAEIKKHQAELKEFKRNVRKFQDKLEAVKAEQAKVGREVSKGERGIKQKQKEAEEQDQKLVPIDEKLSIHDKNVQRYRGRIIEITSDRDQQQAAVEKMQKELATVQKAQKRWEAQWQAEQQKAGRALSREDLQELERLKKNVYQRTGSGQNKIENLLRQLRTDEETVKSLKSKLDGLEATTENLRQEIAALQQRRDDTAQSVTTTNNEIAGTKKSVNMLVSDRDRTEQKRRELDEKLHQVLTRFSEAQGYQRETKKESDQRAMVANLRRIYPGVKGQLGLLVRPKQKKYETAVSTVLGRHFDGIIVDTEKTARDCIAYLKDQHLGQATFIPLDTIVHKQANANLRGMHQGMRLAIDTIDFDTNLERALSFACGNAIVTDTIAIAKELVYKRGVDAKAVTLDGTVIHKGGNMTGGDGPGSSKRRFDDAEIAKLEQLIAKFRSDIDALPKGHKRQAEEEQLRSELSRLDLRQKYAEEELKTLDRNIQSKTKELRHLESQLAELRPKYEEQAEGVQTLQETLQEQKAEVAEVEDEVFAAFCQRTGYANIREYEAQNGELQDEARAKELEFKRQTSRLENQLEYEKQRLLSTEGRLKTTEAAAKRSQDQLAELQAKKDEIAAQLAQINEEIDELQAQIEELKKEFDERGEKVQEARRDLQKRSKGQEKTLKEISVLDAEVQRAASGRYSVLRTCKVDNIDLPLDQDSRKIAALPLEDEALQDEDAMDIDDEDGGTTTRYKDYGIHVDFSILEDDLQEDGSDECEAQLSEKINNLTSSLDKMAPNMRSADRLEATSARLNAVQKDFDQAKKVADRASKAFEEVRQKRMDLFNKAFQHISEQIGPVYKELTKTSSFPLGGSASLDVEDDEEPYLTGVKYHAMPPLKRFRDMEHLSGGEKTMAALALLFAVHTYAPSPFFVLDEVDAALDHANTTQLAQYVKEHAGPGMQFVVISLKTGLFQNSETLVGIMRDQGVNSSRALTLDLRKYQVA
ncbi:Putative structural maintenance of chromosomes protein [Septoria linicola]|uniref:Structural maintenance of chromosomes protein n=1 Tax=Septoria linicola TaxID=215465 RepID=A0A9Q9ADI0_9PEZI|nr:putative structural maintenance of chromosomes protein [Septoria linicola]USW47120.1 Putative structural maintenance of chromosomes protein [Septoria linicola]